MGNVRQLHEPPLTDVAARLRMLADEIEASPPRSAFVILVDESGSISGFNYGAALGTFEQVGILHTVATQMVAATTEA